MQVLYISIPNIALIYNTSGTFFKPQPSHLPPALKYVTSVKESRNFDRPTNTLSGIHLEFHNVCNRVGNIGKTSAFTGTECDTSTFNKLMISNLSCAVLTVIARKMIWKIELYIYFLFQLMVRHQD